MATAPAPPAPTIDLAAVTETYIKIRDARSAAKRAFEAKDDVLKGNLEVIENALLAHLNAQNTESVRTSFGTFYRQVDIKPNIVDDVAFYSWIKDNDAFDALERRVKKVFIKDFMEAHEGAMPPGIFVHKEYVVRVRRGE